MTGRSNPTPETDIPQWMDQAACHNLSSNMFFVERGEDDRPAKLVCAECPVKTDCLEYAIRHGIYYGVWGGTSEAQRRRLRRLRRIQASRDAATERRRTA